MSKPLERQQIVEFREVHRELYMVKQKWMNIGLALGVDINSLKDIEKNYPSIEERYRNMLIRRTNQGNLSWDQVVEALEDVTVEENMTAEAIRSKFIKPQPSSDGNGDGDPTLSTCSKLPPLTSNMSGGTSFANPVSNMPGGSGLANPVLNKPTLEMAGGNSLLRLALGGNRPTVSTTCTAGVASSPMSTPGHQNPAKKKIGGKKNLDRNNLLDPAAKKSGQSGPISDNKPGTNVLGKRKDTESSIDTSKKKAKTAEYWDEGIFAQKSSLSKYRCIHCNRVPKQCYRSKCGQQVKEADKGKGKEKFADNKGLSCRDCMDNPCTNCGKVDYQNHGATSENIRKLKVFCPNKEIGCKEKPALYDRDKHIKEQCLKRDMPCKYQEIGCEVVASGQEREDHERDIEKHFDLAVNTIIDLKQRLDSLQPDIPKPISLAGKAKDK